MPIELVVKNATGLPDKYVDMAVSYIHFLQSQYQQEQQASVSSSRTKGKPILRKAGMLNGQISMTADFDAPLDDFKEYM